MFFDKLKKIEKLCEKAEALYYQQQPEAAEDALLKARDLAASVPDLPMEARMMMHSLLGAIYLFTERPEQALDETLSSLPLWEDRGIEDDQFASVLGSVGEILLELERPVEALPYLERAVTMREKLVTAAPGTARPAAAQGDPAVELAFAYRDLGRTHVAVGRIPDAVLAYEKALAKIGRSGDLSLLTELSCETATHLAELDQPGRAVEILRYAEEAFTGALSAPARSTAGLGPHDMVFELMKKDYAEHGRVPSDFLRLRIERLKLCCQMGQDISAEELPALTATYARVSGDHAPEVADEHQALAVDLHLLGQVSGIRAHLEKAREHYEFALPILTQAMGDDHPDVQRLEAYYEELREDLGL